MSARGYLYLATPYSKYPRGIVAAYEMACRATSDLLQSGISVYSPIAHTHGVAIHGNIDPLDHSIWLPADEPMMRQACGLVVYRAESWDTSFGIASEIKFFHSRRMPTMYLDPGPIPAVIRDMMRHLCREGVAA